MLSKVGVTGPADLSLTGSNVILFVHLSVLASGFTAATAGALVLGSSSVLPALTPSTVLVPPHSNCAD